MSKFQFFLNEYSESAWEKYSKCFDDVDVPIEGIPRDIVNAVITILGVETGLKWLESPLSTFGGKTAIELMSIPEGEKVLRAYIMRLPT